MINIIKIPFKNNMFWVIFYKKEISEVFLSLPFLNNKCQKIWIQKLMNFFRNTPISRFNTLFKRYSLKEWSCAFSSFVSYHMLHVGSNYPLLNDSRCWSCDEKCCSKDLFNNSNEKMRWIANRLLNLRLSLFSQ